MMTPYGICKLAYVKEGVDESIYNPVVVDRGDNQFAFLWQEVSFVLRRLDSMTYNEREKYGDGLYEPENDRGTFEIMDSGEHIKANTYEDENWSYVKITNMAKMINEIRQDGFDCDRLIESGQAIDAATLKDAGK